MPKAGQLRAQPNRVTSDWNSKPKAVGAYIFAGGFTLGMEAAGFRVTDHLEDGKFGAETIKKNRPEIRLHQNPANWPIENLLGPAVVFCNPPCAPWSTAGIVKGQTTAQQSDWRSHPSTQCVERCFSLLDRLKPKIWCFESVRQVYTKAGELLDDMADRAMLAGYSVDDVFVEAHHHGVPQRRKRYFMVCRTVECAYEPPIRHKIPTVYEALAQVSDLDDSITPTPETVAGVASLVGQGENVRKIWDRENAEGRTPTTKRPAFLYDRLRGDSPSYTILGSCNKLHPDEDRMITVEETKALCKFPNNYELVGLTGDCYAQLGKGVCPPVAEYMGRQFMRAILKNVRVSHPIRSRIDIVSVPE